MAGQKIAIYSGVIPSTTFIERLVDGMANSGYRIYLFGTLKKKKRYGKNVVVTAYSNRFGKGVHFLYYSFLLAVFQRKSKKKLDDLLKQQGNDSNAAKAKCYPVLYHRPDIFHLQWAHGVRNWIWVQEFGMKLIVSLRGGQINYSPIADEQIRMKYESTFPKVDGFHAVSKAIAFEAEKYNAPLDKIKVVYSGLSMTDLFFTNHTRINNPLKVVSIGRTHWKKGYHYALDAFSILKKQEFDFEYSIIGIGADEELLIQRSHLDLEKSVRFISQKTFKEVLSVIDEADILLLPSVEEGIANVVLEAMALGTLVVTTDCGGMNEVITDGENGFLIPVRNALVMAEALRKVADLSINEYQKMTLAARKTIENQHSHQRMITDMKTLYESVLKDPS